MRAAVPILGLMLVACDGSPLAPEAFVPEPCIVPAEIVASISPQPFPPAALHSALLHAAGPMTSALGSGMLTTELAKATTQLGQGLQSRAGDTECRVLELASTALARLPDDPAVLPDREGIRLVLALAARAIAGEMTR